MAVSVFRGGRGLLKPDSGKWGDNNRNRKRARAVGVLDHSTKNTYKNRCIVDIDAQHTAHGGCLIEEFY